MDIRKLPLLAIIAMTTSCGGNTSAENETTPPKDLDTALVARGRADAGQVMQLPEGSQQREAAILEIRAREARLRRAGMNKSADSYHAGAASLLDELPQQAD